jgi:hypothetical protein
LVLLQRSLFYPGGFAKFLYTTISTVVPSADATFRIGDPAPLSPDDSVYTPLRPGVMVSFSNLLTTTVGILVENSKGTVVSCGFPERDAQVHQPPNLK